MNPRAVLSVEEIERRFLAHVVADPAKLARARTVRLSPPAAELRENVLRAGRPFYAGGAIAATATLMGAPDDAVRLAHQVDATTAAALGEFTFAELVQGLGGTVARRPAADEAWERELRRLSA